MSCTTKFDISFQDKCHFHLSFSDNSTPLIEKVVACLPNLEQLELFVCTEHEVFMMAAIFNGLRFGQYMDREEFDDILFSDEAFPKLKSLAVSFSCSALRLNEIRTVEGFIASLFSWERPITYLTIKCPFSIDERPGIESSTMLESLSELRLFTTMSMHQIGRFTNLRVLIIHVICNIRGSLHHLKGLSKLERLELCIDRTIEDEEVVELFQPPSDRPQEFFPFGLRILKFRRYIARTTKCAIEAIVGSCPHLRSLNVSSDQCLPQRAVELIIHNLKELEFLHVGHIQRPHYNVLNYIHDDDLPLLRYLIILGNKNSQKKMRQIEKLQELRKGLLIIHDGDKVWSAVPDSEPMALKNSRTNEIITDILFC